MFIELAYNIMRINGCMTMIVPISLTSSDSLLKDADRGIVKIVEDKQPGAKEVETQYETIAVSV